MTFRVIIGLCQTIKVNGRIGKFGNTLGRLGYSVSVSDGSQTQLQTAASTVVKHWGDELA